MRTISLSLIISLLGVLAVSVVFSSGCSWAGRTAGKAQAKIERKADDVQEGYHRGYKEEKAKENQ